ncbi:MAG: 50S ribosomal protein L21 [Candidatus Dormibacteria bacterium]
MYAIVQIGGRQYRAAPGQRVVVDRLEVEPGDEIQLEDVRMVVAEDGDDLVTSVGTPRVSGVAVTATAVSHLRGQKILVFKYKPKKRYRRQRGFRAELTEIRIDSVGELAAEPKRTARSAARPSIEPKDAIQVEETVVQADGAERPEGVEEPAAKRVSGSKSAAKAAKVPKPAAKAAKVPKPAAKAAKVPKPAAKAAAASKPTAKAVRRAPATEPQTEVEEHGDGA